jgi:hypothetical protein
VASSLIGENWNAKSRSAGDCYRGPADPDVSR